MKIKHLFILILLISCNNKKTVPKKDNLFYIRYSRQSNYYDTVSYLNLNQGFKNDTLIHQEAFYYHGINHVINMTTNEFTAGCDGGAIAYKLDDIGIIYLKSTTWYNYLRLETDNDSLNNLIDRAIENILLYKNFTCMKLDTVKINRKEINFVRPQVEE
ncbi:MAG: hypothetical protein HYR91_09910 [Flavobacteriia bacterium]|nr:hypothetical protein [Flavobacteriia bacterium]